MRVKGKLKPVVVYELLAEGPGDAVLRDRVMSYESAFVHYQARGWDEAEKHLAITPGAAIPMMPRSPRCSIDYRTFCAMIRRLKDGMGFMSPRINSGATDSA